MTARFRPHASIDDVARSMAFVGLLVAAFGAAMIVGPGYLNPRRFRQWFVVGGLLLFFAPGVLGAVAGFLIPRRARGAWMLGLAATVAQLAIAVVGFAGQFFVTPISVVPLVLCAAWALASVALLVALVRYRHQLQSDTPSRGFAVEFAQTDSDRVPK